MSFNASFSANPLQPKAAQMKSLILSTMAAAGLLVSASPSLAHGCMKGALIGGIAGHYAGHHGILGATVGCLVGRHEAHKEENRNQDYRHANDGRYAD